jgi:lipid-A-disaccharide synthase
MKIYIVAGEASGDLLGAAVMRAILEQDGQKHQINGVGGDCMTECGLESLFVIDALAVGGITETFWHIRKIMKLIRLTVDHILKTRPDVVFTIDSPDFCFRVAELVRKANAKIKLIHFVAPSVWAWRPWRAGHVAKLYDHLLTLFDFEPQYFLPHGLKVTHVGHPVIETHNEITENKDDTLLLMPGSRPQEIKKLLPIFIEAASKIKAKKVVIPTLKRIERYVDDIIIAISRTCDIGTKIEHITDNLEKESLYQTAKLAIVASGTATLQLALAGCPMIVCYRLSGISYAIVRMLTDIKYISLVNIIANKPVVPELIQKYCTPETIATTAKTIDYHKQITGFRELPSRLRPTSGVTPSKTIASIITNS